MATQIRPSLGLLALLWMAGCTAEQRQYIDRKIFGGPVVRRTPTAMLEDDRSEVVKGGADVGRPPDRKLGRKIRRVRGDALAKALDAAGSNNSAPGHGGSRGSFDLSDKPHRRPSPEVERIGFSTDLAGHVPVDQVPDAIPLVPVEGAAIRSVYRQPPSETSGEHWSWTIESPLGAGKLAEHYLDALQVQGYDTSHVDVPSPGGRVIQIMGQRRGARIEGQFSRNKGDLHTRATLQWRERPDPERALKRRRAP